MDDSWYYIAHLTCPNSYGDTLETFCEECNEVVQEGQMFIFTNTFSQEKLGIIPCENIHSIVKRYKYRR